MLNKIWRYSINAGEFGGIVIANTLKEATEKVANKYKDKNKEEIEVWAFENDEYHDQDNADVIECYGI